MLTQNITAVNGTSERLHPQYDMNNNTFISIFDELKPRLIDILKSVLVVTPGEKCLAGLCPIWHRSQYSSIPTLDIISKVPSDTSILIQQGKNDSQTPIQQAFLLQQELTEVRHPGSYIDNISGPWPCFLSFFSMVACFWTNGTNGSGRPFYMAFRSSQRL